jgi:hypothetical protein
MLRIDEHPTKKSENNLTRSRRRVLAGRFGFLSVFGATKKEKTPHNSYSKSQISGPSARWTGAGM